MSDLAHGPWVASLTPLNGDLSIDTGACRAHIDGLFAQGAAGIAALGTTGEANSFSLAERLELIAFLGKSGIAPDRLLIGTGCCSTGDTVALTRAALDAGYSNVMMLPPFYYKGVSDDGLFAAFARAIETVNDPRLRVVIYDFPAMTGLVISTALLKRLRDAFPGVVIGVKNSSGDWSAMDDALKQLPGFGVFAGSEQFLLPTLRAGGPGCISAVANVNIGNIAAIAQDWRSAGADVLQQGVTATRVALTKFPTVPMLKELMAVATGRAQWRNIRPPLVSLSAAQRAELDAARKHLAISLFA